MSSINKPYYKNSTQLDIRGKVCPLTFVYTKLVLEELDKFVSYRGDDGNNVRTAIRTLDELRNQGHLNKGVKLENGGIVMVMIGHEHPSIPLKNTKVSKDNRLLSTAKTFLEHSENPTIIVTKNVGLRVRADAHDIMAVDYEKDKSLYDYTGWSLLNINIEQHDRLIDEGVFYINDPDSIGANEFFRFTCEGKNVNVLGRHTEDGQIVRLDKKTAMKIKERNIEQAFALNALLNDDITVVTLQAKAGAGKTLLAVAAALQKVKDKKYKKIVIARPVISVGKDIGHLPGEMEEKMAPWMKPIMDNIEIIASNGGYTETDLAKYLEISPLAYIRGRSFSNAFIIIDEAQNLTPLEIKTIATRVGEGSKIVFTGDVSQIDIPTLDESSSGFTHLINKFKEESLHAHIQLSKSERSVTADKAAELL